MASGRSSGAWVSPRSMRPRNVAHVLRLRRPRSRFNFSRNSHSATGRMGKGRRPEALQQRPITTARRGIAFEGVNSLPNHSSRPAAAREAAAGRPNGSSIPSKVFGGTGRGCSRVDHAQRANATTSTISRHRSRHDCLMMKSGSRRNTSRTVSTKTTAQQPAPGQRNSRTVVRHLRGPSLPASPTLSTAPGEVLQPAPLQQFT